LRIITLPHTAISISDLSYDNNEFLIINIAALSGSKHEINDMDDSVITLYIRLNDLCIVNHETISSFDRNIPAKERDKRRSIP